MSYAFKYDAFNKMPNVDEDYSSKRSKSVDITLIADSETDALAKAKTLVEREEYKLEQIDELTDLHTAGHGSW